MSTQAFVSGRLGKAVVLDHDRKRVIDQDMSEREPTPGEISELFSEAAETRWFPVNSMETARSHLEEEILFQDALFLFLSACDPDLSLSTRIMCGQELEPLVGTSPLSERIVSRLLSAPMPVAIRARRRETISLFASFNHFAVCLRRVFALQEYCDEVCAAWKEAAKSVPLERASVLAAEMIEDGTVASIVVALSSKDLYSFNTEFVSQSIRQRDPSIDQTAKAILARIGESLRPHLSRGSKSQRVLPLKVGRRRSSQSADIIGEAMQREQGVEGWPQLSPFETKTRVDKQIAGIASELFRGREDLAEKYIADLVHFQLSNSEKDHLAKSLCNLAAKALDANKLEMAERLSHYAAELGVNDPVIFTTRAEVLKNMGSLAASLEAFREAKILFPHSGYAWNGIADVLNEMGKYEESLAAYRESQEKFSDSPVPFNGYVSVLRAQGERKKAIKYALTVVQRFPGDAVSRSNLASALRDDGRYSQAARQYQEALRLDGKNPKIILGYVGTLCLTAAGAQGALGYLEDRLQTMPGSATLLNAKASHLRRAGMLSESLAVAEKLITEHPTYTPALFNSAATLVALGRNEEARQTIPVAQNLRSELDWSGPRIFAIALAAEGHYSEAAEKLELALASCPWIRELSRIRTTLGYVQMKLGKGAESVRTLERDLRSLDESHQQLRLVLLGEAQATRGNSSVASILLGNMVSTKDQLLSTLRQRYLTSLQTSQPKVDDMPDRDEIRLLLAA